MMPTVGARIDSSEDDMGANYEGEGKPAPDESNSDILLMAWMQTVA